MPGVSPRPTDWGTYALGSDNAEVEVNQAAVSGQEHYITSITASYDEAAVGLLTLEDGDGVTQLLGVHVFSHVEITFPHPIRITAEAVLTLAAGGAGVAGAVSMQGYSN